MRRASLFLLCLAWLGGCTEKEPFYCDDKVPCTLGFVCAMPAHRCVPGQSGGDGALQGDMAMSMVDMAMNGTECKSHAECAMKSASTPACVAGKCQPCTRNFH